MVTNERVTKELKSIPLLQVFPSAANFILTRSWKIPAREIYLSLYEKGVAIRYFDTPELKDCLRITIGTPGENTLLLEKLKQIIILPEKILPSATRGSAFEKASPWTPRKTFV